MAVTAWKTPGTVTSEGAGVAWSGLGNVAASDSAYASCALSSGAPSSQSLRLVNFGFTTADVPAGATIDGVEDEVVRSAGFAVTDGGIFLRLTAGQVGFDQSVAGIWNPVTFGGPTNTWGATLTAADVVTAAFGVDFVALRSSGTPQADVDFYRRRIHYTLGVTTVTGTLASETETVFQGAASSPVTVTATRAAETETVFQGAASSPVVTTVTGTRASETETAAPGSVTAGSTVTGTLAAETETVFPGVASTPAVPLTVAAPDRPVYDSEFLVTIGAATVRVGTNDRIIAGETFYGNLEGAPTLEQSLDDVFYGFTQSSRGALEITNPAGRFTELWDGIGGSDYRGQPIAIARYDPRTATQIPEFTGIVDKVSLTLDTIRVEYVNRDLSVLDTLVPRTTFTTAVYGTACPCVGQAEQKVIGNAEKIPLRTCKDDVPGVAFWHFLSVGTGYTVANVYRDMLGQFAGQQQLLSPAEYEVRTDLVAGRTIIRTFVRQLKSGGGLHQLYADVTGAPAIDRNPARVWRTALSDTTWGASEPVDATSFDTAEAAVPAALVVDGVIGLGGRQITMRELANQILPLRGMRAGYGATGHTLVVDVAASTAQMAIRFGLSSGEQTALALGDLSRPALEDDASTYSLSYRPELVQDDPSAGLLRTSTRAVNPVGLPKDDDVFWLVRDPTAADLVANYRAKRLRYNGRGITGLQVNEEGRQLLVGQIVQVTGTWAGTTLTQQDMQIVRARKETGLQTLDVLGWDQDIYVYTPGTLPTPPAIDQGVTPPALTSFTVSSSGNEISADNTITAFFILQLVVPASPAIEYTRLRSRRTSTATYGDSQTVAGSGTILVRLAGLVPGQSYDFQAATVSGAVESTPSTISGQVAPSLTPPALSSLAFASSGTEVANDGTVSAFIILTAGVPSGAGVQHTRVRFRKNGTTTYGNTITVPGTGTISARFAGLVPGQSYDFQAATVIGSLEGTPSTVLAQVAPSVSPPALTSFTVSSSGVEAVSDDGKFAAFFVLSLGIPSSPAPQYTRVRYKRSGTSTSGNAQQVQGTGTVLARVSGLEPGLSYDFEAATVIGSLEGSVSTITNQLAPGDTTPPAVPNTPAPQSIHLRTVMVFLTQVTDNDTTAYDIEVRSASGGGGTLYNAVVAKHSPSAAATSVAVTVTGAAYGATVYIRARARDFSGNASAFSGDLTVTLGRTVLDDHGDESVDSRVLKALAVLTAKVNDLAITSAKRANLTRLTGATLTAIPIGGSMPGSVAHGLGRIPVAIPAPNSFQAFMSITVVDATNVNYIVFNNATGVTINCTPTVDII